MQRGTQESSESEKTTGFLLKRTMGVLLLLGFLADTFEGRLKQGFKKPDFPLSRENNKDGCQKNESFFFQYQRFS